MLFAGILLVLFFVVPTTLDPLAFQFEQFKAIGDLPITGVVTLLLVPLIGIVSIIVAVLGIGTVVRGAIAAVLGFGSIGWVFYASGLFDHMVWQAPVMLVSAVFTIAGLAIRGRYFGSLPARLLATIGALGALAVVLVPSGDKMLISEVFDGLTSGNTVALVSAVVVLLSVLVSVLGLLSWLPATGSAGASLLAVVMLFVMIGGMLPGLDGLVTHFADGLFGGIDGASIGDRLSALVKSPSEGLFGWAPITAFTALAGFGLAGILGRPASS